MTTLHKAVRVALLAGLSAGSLTMASAALQEANGAPKKPERTKTPAASVITVEFTISAEGMAAIPSSSTVEFRGLNGCDASAVGVLNSKGQGKFKSLPSCKVELEIFISGSNARFAQVDVSKYQGSPVGIEIPKSGPAKVTFPGSPPPTVSPTK